MSAKPDATVSKDAPASDGSGSSHDAATICDPTATFDTPVALTPLNTTGDEGAPRLTADELEVVFNRTVASSSDSNLYIANRASMGAAFGSAAAITAADSASEEYNPSLSSDGLTLIFESYRTGNIAQLYVSTRSSTIGTFSTPSLVAGVNSGTSSDAQPFFNADGSELWFVSTRPGGLGAYDIYLSVKNGTVYGTPVAQTALSSANDDWLPTISAAGLTIYLTSNRPGGAGGYDIFTSHRSTTSDGFPTPTPVTELNTTADDLVGWLSADNCRLYFATKNGTNNDIYVATRHP